jgi:hypothetical protein
MKSIYKGIFFLLGLFMFNTAVKGQGCSSILVEAVGANPQMGAYNYFGIRVTLLNPHYDNITVTGFIHRDMDEEGNQDHPFTLTVTAGTTVTETPINFYQTDPASGASVTIASISHCPANEIYASYAGVTIAYELDNNMLRFNSGEDLYAVINQLDEDYENHNTAYESNYDPNLTSEQMDDIDDQTGFDDMYTFRVFENFFPGFLTKRRQLEIMEDNWLNNNFSGTDPDDVDFTFGDAENTIYSSNYTVKVGNDVYQLTSSGLWINGALQSRINGGNNGLKASMAAVATNPVNVFGLLREDYDAAPRTSVVTDDNLNLAADILGDGCKSNKQDAVFHEAGDTRFKIKVAINGFWAVSMVKGKVKHFKRKNGHWKKKRAKMAVYAAGSVYNNSCAHLFDFSQRKPVSGWVNRKHVTTRRGQGGIVWRTWPQQLGASFEAQAGYTGGVILNF